MAGSASEQASEFREFVDRHVAPYADDFHQKQRTPPEIIAALAARGYLGLSIPRDYGGGGYGDVTLGVLAGELGRGCSSLRSLLTVHTMVARTIQRWGTRAQKERWLPKLASGAALGALALSEPTVGSDASGVEMRAVVDGEDFVLTGEKVWITYGQVADLFLVFARSAEGPTAYLLERTTPGLTTIPILDLIGIRASMTARLKVDGCRVSRDQLVGRPGLGITQVAATALDCGRFTVAWGCVGILEACLAASTSYTREREQFGVALREHQLVRHMISDMMTSHRAARALCLEAGLLREARDPAAFASTSIAKYFASVAAVRAASDALQLHGANGCSGDYPLQRYLGDAKVMEVIEGSSQIQQVTIADYAYQDYSAARVSGGNAAWRHS